MNAESYFDILKKTFLNIPALAWIIVFIGVVGGIAYLLNSTDQILDFAKKHFGGKEPSENEQLIKNTEELATQIFEFHQDRGKNKPKDDPGNFWESANRSSAYMQESLSLYSIRFQSRVTDVREEYLKKGISNKDVDMYYKDPVNYIGIRELASGLNELASKLKAQ